MLGRAFALAVAAMLAFWADTPARAQNLLAGQTPSQIFSNTCSLCHKSARGMLKTVSPGSLPGFLRQHYTTSTEMAGVLSAFVLSNGATDTRLSGGDNLTKKGKQREDKPSLEPSGVSENREAQQNRDAARERKPRPGETEQAARTEPAARPEAARPDAQRPDTEQLQPVPGGAAPDAEQDDAAQPAAPAQPKAAAKQKASKSRATKGEQTKPAETAKLDTPAARPDPVPQVTPAPTGPEALEALKPKPVEEPKQLTVDISPALQANVPKPSMPVASGGPAPSPPISH